MEIQFTGQDYSQSKVKLSNRTLDAQNKPFASCDYYATLLVPVEAAYGLAGTAKGARGDQLTQPTSLQILKWDECLPGSQIPTLLWLY